ncbi:hypothetical protein HMSSN139_24440 [Paenibacillus sp. HMSSN-139]|nr:hypothetical protein HMSSN139_24440 [Paenibacillus sp. HMSSN-139]
MIDGELDSDMYGIGQALEAFEAKMAGVLGKASAVFFPAVRCAANRSADLVRPERDETRGVSPPMPSGDS